MFLAHLLKSALLEPFDADSAIQTSPKHWYLAMGALVDNWQNATHYSQKDITEVIYAYFYWSGEWFCLAGFGSQLIAVPNTPGDPIPSCPFHKK